MNRVFAVFLVFSFSVLTIFAQEDSYEDLLNEKILNENPIYKPVIGIGTGVFNFYGDVKNNYPSPSIGNFGYKINFSTFANAKRFLKLNLFFIYGQTSANQRSLTNPEQNLNFKTDLVDFGVNFEYSFDHLYKKQPFIKPYIAIGIENIQFTPKGDLFRIEESSSQNYFYWSDGSIRNLNEEPANIASSKFIYRDYKFETDLRQREKELYNMGTYSKNAFSIPVDIGLNMKISDRIGLKIGTSLHYTFTDFIDNVSSTGSSLKGKKGNDMIFFNYFSLDFDLFSEPKEIIIEKMFAELEFDEVMYDDEDGDFVLDAADQCPGTPYGVATDTLGCPLDEDNDGIADYLDKEKFSPQNAWVDKNGITISEEKYLSSLLSRNDAMKRSDVMAYFETIGKSFVRKSVTEIPEKFKELDTDSDAYISFDELLKAIDKYFDQNLNLNVEDIYELNNFFFCQ